MASSFAENSAWCLPHFLKERVRAAAAIETLGITDRSSLRRA
jgi:hypothetical protein